MAKNKTYVHDATTQPGVSAGAYISVVQAIGAMITGQKTLTDEPKKIAKYAGLTLKQYENVMQKTNLSVINVAHGMEKRRHMQKKFAQTPFSEQEIENIKTLLSDAIKKYAVHLDSKRGIFQRIYISAKFDEIDKDDLAAFQDRFFRTPEYIEIMYRLDLGLVDLYIAGKKIFDTWEHPEMEDMIFKVFNVAVGDIKRQKSVADIDNYRNASHGYVMRNRRHR